MYHSFIHSVFLFIGDHTLFIKTKKIYLPISFKGHVRRGYDSVADQLGAPFSCSCDRHDARFSFYSLYTSGFLEEIFNVIFRSYKLQSYLVIMIEKSNKNLNWICGIFRSLADWFKFNVSFQIKLVITLTMFLFLGKSFSDLTINK